MTKNLKKNIFVVILLAVVLCFAAISAINVGNASAPSTSYQTGEYELSSSEYNAVCYTTEEVTSASSTKSYDSVWINFGGYAGNNAETVKIRLLFASSESSSFSELATKEIQNDAESLKIGGWVCIADNITASTLSNRPYVLLATQNEIFINEVAFVGKLNGKRSVLEMKAVAEGVKNSVTASLSSSSEFSRTDSAIASAGKLIDEQSKFELYKSNTVKNEDETYTSYYDTDVRSLFTENEANTVAFMRNLFSEKGEYVDASVNPLGACVLGIGTAIFGYTTFGIRIMPLLFTVATIILLYFIGNTLFGKEIYGLMLSVLFAIGGYALSFATYGSAVSVMVFFALLSVYFAFKFYKKGISKIHPVKSYLNIVLSGLFFAIAVAVKTQALYVGVITTLFLVLGIIRQYQYYLSKKQQAKEEDLNALNGEYVLKFRNTLLLSVMGMILIPVLLITGSFLSAYKTMSVFYGSANLLTYGAAHFSASFYGVVTAYSAINAYSPFGWIINYSAEKLSADKFIFGNIVIAIVNLVSLIFCGYVLVKKILNLVNKNMTETEKYNRFIPMLVAFCGFIVLWILNFIGAKGIGSYYVPTIFGYILTVFAFIELKENDKKVLFRLKGNDIMLFDVIACGVLSLATVAFALAVPAFIGLPAAHGLFAFNVLSGSVFD